MEQNKIKEILKKAIFDNNYTVDMVLTAIMKEYPYTVLKHIKLTL